MLETYAGLTGTGTTDLDVIFNPDTGYYDYIFGEDLNDPNNLQLIDAGGFSFWRQLPQEHSGEDVLAQMRVMERFGGCGLFPSGVYHQELPTTVPHRDADAPRVLRATG